MLACLRIDRLIANNQLTKIQMTINYSKLLWTTLLLGFLLTNCTTELDEGYEPIAEMSEELDQRSRSRYVIVLKEGLDISDLSDVRGMGKGLLNKISANQEPEYVYGKALLGFTAYLSPGQVRKLSKFDEIVTIEKDGVLSLAPPPGKGWNKGGDDTPDAAPPQSTPWGINRVNGGLASNGRAFILDSGIDLDHADLNIDRSVEFSAFRRGRDSGTNDRNGHGTHVAGTIAAIDNQYGVIGVAAGASVVPIKVLDGSGSGSWSGILAGVDHVAQYGRPGDVANLSLGGGANSTLDNAIKNAAANSGVRFVLAAGNSSQDANYSSPARANGPNIYTISAMDRYDRFASFSNYGSAVDYCSPGVSILSTWNDGGYHTTSGTSMAAPHVAGLLLIGASNIGGYVKNDPDGQADPILVK